MKFSKYNNPSKKRARRASTYSQAYIDDRQNELYKLLAQCNTEEEKDAIIKAFDVTMNPFRT